MKAIIILILFLFMGSCSTNNGVVSVDDVNRDVAASRALLNQVKKYNDSLNVALSLLDARIEELLLLSKDVENPAACAAVGNRYFETMFGELSLKQADRILLTARLGKEDMELVIRQNELFVLNELVFQNSGNDVRLFSVQEKTEE